MAIAPYAGTAWTGAGATVAGTGVNVVPYEPGLTHRVTMQFQKVGTPNVDNATNATFDFVPSGAAVSTRRNIVTMASCNTCHAGGKLHSGYATEYCVGCHNSSTFDPYTGETVDLQRLVHKIHMGKELPSVVAGGGYVVNGTHNYSGVGYPGRITNCTVCHDESATKPGTTTKLENAANWYTMPTKAACGSCHDGQIALAHIDQNIYAGIETCTTCHSPTSLLAVDAKRAHGR